MIMIMCHAYSYRSLKYFYQNEVCVNLRHLFPKVVSYNRFVEMEKETAIPQGASISAMAQFFISDAPG